MGLPATSPRRIQIPNTHLTVIGNQVKRIVCILKLVCTEDDQLESMFRVMFPDGTADLLANIQQLKSGKDVLQSAVGAVGAVGDVMDKGFDKMAQGTERVVGGTAKAVTAVVGGTVGGVKAVGGAVGGVGNKVGDGFKEMGDKTKSAFGNMGAKTGDAFKNSFNVIKAVGHIGGKKDGGESK